MESGAAQDERQMSPLDKARAFAASRHRLFIGGEWAEPAEGRRFETHDPATGRRLADVAEAGKADVDAAAAAARRAMDNPAWSGMKPAARARLLNRLADALEAHVDEFAALALDEAGDVSIDGEAIGRLDGFRFVPDPRGGDNGRGLHGRTLRAAALASRMAQLAVVDFLFLRIGQLRFDDLGAVITATRRAVDDRHLPTRPRAAG